MGTLRYGTIYVDARGGCARRKIECVTHIRHQTHTQTRVMRTISRQKLATYFPSSLRAMVCTCKSVLKDDGNCLSADEDCLTTKEELASFPFKFSSFTPSHFFCSLHQLCSGTNNLKTTVHHHDEVPDTLCTSIGDRPCGCLCSQPSSVSLWNLLVEILDPCCRRSHRI
jgi:hypothetical protein